LEDVHLDVDVLPIEDVESVGPLRRTVSVRYSVTRSGPSATTSAPSGAGGSPSFESRRQALVFCNRNAHIIETTAPITH